MRTWRTLQVTCACLQIGSWSTWYSEIQSNCLNNLSINTTRIQVERESVYSIMHITAVTLYQDYDRNHLDNHDYIIIIINL